VQRSREAAQREQHHDASRDERLAANKQGKELGQTRATTKAETEKLSKVELTIPELQGFSKNYQTLLNDTVAAARAIGKAVATSSPYKKP
jgi:hypothetical protein